MDHDEPQPCKPGEHLFSVSRETNEPVGRCQRCSISVEGAEQQWEDAEELALTEPPSTDDEPEPTEDEQQAWAQRDLDRALGRAS